jgi:hypothetical protein
LKTHLGLDLCVSLAIGPSTKFLDNFPVTRPVAVGLLAAEDPDGLIDDALERICRAKGVDLTSLEGRLFLQVGKPWTFDTESIEDLKQFIVANDLKFCLVEAAYMSLGGADQRSLSAMGHALSPITKLVAETGCAIELATHFKGSASNSRYPTLNDISGVGPEEAARSWLLVNKRREWNPTTGEHWLRLSIGNKYGEQRFLLDVREGNANAPEGRVWEVTVTPGGATEDVAATKGKTKSQPAVGGTAVGAAAPKPSENLTDHETAMLAVLAKHPEGLCATHLGRKSKVSYRQWKPTVDSLLKKKLIIEVPIVGRHRKEMITYKLQSRT